MAPPSPNACLLVAFGTPLPIIASQTPSTTLDIGIEEYVFASNPRQSQQGVLGGPLHYGGCGRSFGTQQPGGQRAGQGPRQDDGSGEIELGPMLCRTRRGNALWEHAITVFVGTSLPSYPLAGAHLNSSQTQVEEREMKKVDQSKVQAAMAELAQQEREKQEATRQRCVSRGPAPIAWDDPHHSQNC